MKKVLSFDCGGTNTRLALINEKLEIEKELFTPTPTQSKEVWMDNIISMIQQFPLEDVVAIGVGVPGVCDVENGVIIDLPNVGIKDIKFREILTKKFSLPVFLRNDAEVACLGEAYGGAGKGKDRVFFITISTGLGGSLCIDQKIQDYVHEIGHTAYVYKNHVSEFEKLVSGLNIHNLAKINNIEKVKTAIDMFNGVRNNDNDCLFLFNEWKTILNKFLDMVINSYLPDVICITGGLTKAKDLFLDDLIKNHPETEIKECKFGEYAGLIGSAVLALQGAKII